MGRGRAKAKQTKVARELKYSSPDTDLTALQRELSGSEAHNGSSRPARVPTSDIDPYSDDESEDDPYADYVSKYADRGDDDDRWASSSSR